MSPVLESKIGQLAGLCPKRHVRRLALFGSAVEDRFNPDTSDLDLLVEFQPMPPAEHADNYFGFQEDLQRLFGFSVDLVEPGSIRNPYFRQAVEQTQLLLYEAA